MKAFRCYVEYLGEWNDFQQRSNTYHETVFVAAESSGEASLIAKNSVKNAVSVENITDITDIFEQAYEYATEQLGKKNYEEARTAIRKVEYTLFKNTYPFLDKIKSLRGRIDYLELTDIIEKEDYAKLPNLKKDLKEDLEVIKLSNIDTIKCHLERNYPDNYKLLKEAEKKAEMAKGLKKFDNAKKLIDKKDYTGAAKILKNVNKNASKDIPIICYDLFKQLISQGDLESADSILEQITVTENNKGEISNFNLAYSKQLEGQGYYSLAAKKIDGVIITSENEEDVSDVRYKVAKGLFNKADYQTVRSLLEPILQDKNHKDISVIYSESSYLYGKQLMRQEKYEKFNEAAGIFEKLEGYKNSRLLAKLNKNGGRLLSFIPWTLLGIAAILIVIATVLGLVLPHHGILMLLGLSSGIASIVVAIIGIKDKYDWHKFRIMSLISAGLALLAFIFSLIHS